MRKLLVASVLIFAATANYITYSNCSDKAFCAEGCQTVTMPATCQFDSKSGGSQLFACTSGMHLCGDFFYYADPNCDVLISSMGWICDQCDATKNQRIDCSLVNGKQMIMVNHCNTPECGGCTVVASIPANSCTKITESDGSVSYIKYVGAYPCGVVRGQEWPKGNVDCSGEPTNVKIIPENSCIQGQRINCTYT